MRLMTIWLAVALSHLTPAHAAPSSWCFHFLAVDVVDCKDKRLTTLREKIQKTYGEALAELKGTKRAALVREQNSWLGNRARKCGMHRIELIRDESIRRVRPCLVELYEARIAKLSEIVNSRGSGPKSESLEVVTSKGENKGTAASTAAAQYSPDLAGRKRFWEQQVFQCKVGNDVYPSKNQEVYDPKRRYDPNVPKQVWEADYIRTTVTMVT